MNIDVDKIVVSLDVVAPDSVVVEASAVAPSGIVTEAVAELPTQVIVISHEETPTVSPLQIIDYGSSSIECAFDVTTEQAEEVVKGVLCGTTNPPTFENADYRLLHGQGSMDLAFAGLQNNTEYYLRSYALSNLGYKYGDVITQRTKPSPIPNEYQLVEYLEGNGLGAYLILNHPLDWTTFSINFSHISQSQDIVIGINSNIKFWLSGDTQVENFYFGAFSTNNSIIYQHHTFIYNRVSGNLSVDREEAVLYSNHPIAVPDRYLTLFNLSRSSGNMYYSKARIYNFTLDDMLNLYPVYRKFDNKPGMYDIINNVFYTNAGTGEFTVGPDKEWEE